MSERKLDQRRLAEALARARIASETLNGETDALNGSIIGLQTTVASLRLGVEASVFITESSDSASGFWSCISFEKEGNEWMFTYSTGQDEEVFGTVPLVKAAKTVRLNAVKHFPAIVEKLVTAAEGQTEEVRKARLEVEELTRIVAAASVAEAEMSQNPYRDPPAKPGLAHFARGIDPNSISAEDAAKLVFGQPAPVAGAPVTPPSKGPVKLGARKLVPNGISMEVNPVGPPAKAFLPTQDGDVQVYTVTPRKGGGK